MNDDQDITERVHRLARGVEVQGVDPAADVRRGRARLRRRRTLAVVASAAAVAGVAGGVAAFSAVGGAGHDTITPADGASPTGLASVSTPTPTGTPTGTASCGAGPTNLTATQAASALLDDPLKNPTIRHALSSYASILSSHLDPQGFHLQTAPTGFTGNPDLPCDPKAPVELGTKLAWKTPGKAGEAMVFVSVTNDWADDQIHLALDQWKPVTYPADQVTRAWEAANGAAVAVEHTDGTVVAIQTDALFGNDSLTPVAGFGFTVDQLLTTAADPAFVLP